MQKNFMKVTQEKCFPCIHCTFCILEAKKKFTLLSTVTLQTA